MTLKQGLRVKFDTCKRFADHDFQLVIFSFQTSRANDKGDIGAFRSPPTPFDIKEY